MIYDPPFLEVYLFIIGYRIVCTSVYTLIISLFSRVDWPAVTLCSSRPSGPSLDWFSWNCKSAKIENKSCNIQWTFGWIHDWQNLCHSIGNVIRVISLGRLSRRSLRVSCAFLNPSALQYFSVFLGGINESLENVDFYVTRLLQINKWKSFESVLVCLCTENRMKDCMIFVCTCNGWGLPVLFVILALC